MIQQALSDPIAAVATPAGRGALAIVRVSGQGAVSLADSVFRGQKSLRDLSGFQGALGFLYDEDTPIDEVIAWVYRAPHTFTGDDLVEFSCHGGSGLPERILEALWKKGARPAGPGEFTRRAFLNGRLDLTQAEAVAELIAARGERAQQQALNQLEGGLSRRIRDLAEPLRGVLARLTVYLDFDEDVPEVPDMPALVAVMDETATQLEGLRKNYLPSTRLRDGLRVALVGRPNVGKSSLLNCFLGSDRALVHEEPGTTRDVIDAYVTWDGLAIRLFDTAGLRDGDHPVEKAGIDRSRSTAEASDLVLWILDGSQDAAPEDIEIGKELQDRPPGLELYVVANKSDLGFSNLEWVNIYSPSKVVKVSALSGDGVEDLKGAIVVSGLRSLPEEESFESVNERHAHLLDIGVEALGRGSQALREHQPAELAAADLGRCLEALGEITGDKAGPELLDTIFSRFCIGK